MCFAYGSNLDVFQMIKRVGEWKTSRRAYIEGYRLVFDKDSERWGGFTANIHRTGNASDRVYGVVYELRRKKLDVLAEYEGKEPTTSIPVTLEDGQPLPNVGVFLFDPSGKSGALPKAYQNAISDGLRQHGFSKGVQEQVASLMLG